MKYKIVVNRHGEKVERYIENKALKYALHNLLKECIEDDDTGIFFELENADVNTLKKDRRFHIINQYGIILEDVECIDETKPSYANDFRAKREMLGYSLPELAIALGVSDMTIKRIESGKSDFYKTYLKLENLFTQTNKKYFYSSEYFDINEIEIKIKKYVNHLFFQHNMNINLNEDNKNKMNKIISKCLEKLEDNNLLMSLKNNEQIEYFVRQTILSMV